MKIPVSWYIDLFAEFIPVGIGIARRRFWDKPVAFFVLYEIATVITGVTTFYLGLHGINTRWIFHVHVLVCTEVMLAAFLYWFQQSKILTRCIWVVAIGFIIFWIAEKIWLAGWSEPPVYTLSTSNILLLSFALIMNVQLFRSVGVFRNPRYWISAGLAIYCGGNLLPYLLIGVLDKMKIDLALAIWTIPVYISMLTTLFYIRAMLCLGKD